MKMIQKTGLILMVLIISAIKAYSQDTTVSMYPTDQVHLATDNRLINLPVVEFKILWQ